MLTEKIVKDYEHLVEQGEIDKRITRKLDAIVRAKKAEMSIERQMIE